MNHTIINGIKTYVFSSKKELIDFAIKQKKILVAINAEKILYATDVTRAIINKNIGYADGIGAVWALNKKGFKNAIKIPGCELWLDIIRYFYKEKTFYLVGAKEEVLQETVKKLKNEFHGINLLGYRNGYLKTNEEKTALINDIVTKKPDIVYVAMGSPKQELLMHEMHILHPAVYQGLGGSFDVYLGKVKRAPDFWINNNLEGFYRDITHPFSRMRRGLHMIDFIYKLKMRKFE